MNSTHWPEDRSDKLAGYVSGGAMSFAQIAAAINAEFGTTYSRNAAIGRAGRMGLTNPYQIKTVKKEPSPRSHRAKRSPEFRAIAPVQSIEQIKLRCVEIEPRLVALIDLTPEDCRYPFGYPALFCGHPKSEGSSYCSGHRALAYYAPQRISEDERERRRRQALKNHKNTMASAS